MIKDRASRFHRGCFISSLFCPARGRNGVIDLNLSLRLWTFSRIHHDRKPALPMSGPEKTVIFNVRGLSLNLMRPSLSVYISISVSVGAGVFYGKSLFWIMNECAALPHPFKSLHRRYPERNPMPSRTANEPYLDIV